MDGNDTQETQNTQNTQDIQDAQYPQKEVAPEPPQQNTGSKKLFGKLSPLMALILVFLLLLGGSAAAYFGLIVPNKPENIWKTALGNTAKGYDRLVEYSEKQKDVAGGNIKGTFKIESSEFVADGNVNGKFDDKTTDITIDAGAAGARVSLNVLTNIPDGATTPDIYVKADGLSGLSGLLGGGTETAQMLSAFEGQYYFLDHTLIDQFSKSAEQDTGALSGITEEDVVAAARTIGEVNKEYLFTTDSSKAVLKVKSEIGKEVVDGRDVYHYKVGIDKPHLKEYLASLKEALKTTKLKDLVKDEAFDDAIESVDNIKDTDEADVWVDMDTKLIRTVRFANPDNDKQYMDFGMLYEGGDEYPFYITFKDDKEGDRMDMTLKLTVNFKTSVASINIDSLSESNGGEVKITANMDFEPSADKVEFSKPEGAKSIGDLFAPFLGTGMPAGFDNSDVDDLGDFDF